MSRKALFGFIAGAVTVAAAAYVAVKVVRDIEDTPSETGEFKEKANRWYANKREIFKHMIDEKNHQITDIVTRLKEEIVSEIDPEKRKELFDNAVNKVSQIRNEISEITVQRSKEFAEYAKNLTKSEFVGNIIASLNNVKDSIVSHCKKRPMALEEADITYYEE